MALRLHDCTVRGEIDNRARDRVTGRIWFKGLDEPVILDLAGNCLRDIAGCRVAFENPAAPQDDARLERLSPIQEGVVGDITASRKVKVLQCSLEESRKLAEEKKPIPTGFANACYIEWFSDVNGRVVLESTGFRVTDLSEPAWRMSREEEREQVATNVRTLREFVDRQDEGQDAADEVEDGEEDDGPMDEFGWERFLKDSDRRSGRFQEVFEKYFNHPDRDKLIAREMGWEWLDDAMDADERGAFEVERRQMEKDEEEAPGLVPDPITEGVDWIRTDDDIRHPLQHRATEAAMSMWKYCDERGLLKEGGNRDVQAMVSEAEILSAKLAGALNQLAYDCPPEDGFIVACLKRALKFLEASLGALARVRKRKIIDDQRLEEFRIELFEIREEMLRLMDKHRGR